MNENVMFIRVAAVDLSGMVEEMEALRYRLREMDKKLSTETQTWAQETGEVVRQYSDFRRAVQEALGLDQPELVDEDTAVEGIRQLRRVLPWKSFSIDVVDPGARPDDDVAGRPAYAKMIEREPATLADGTQARFFSDARPDEGPPTESMPAVEEPPDMLDGYSIGRVFHRGDPCPDQDSLDLVINRSGDVMRVFTDASGAGGVVVHPDGREVGWSEQLHMNGTLWEIVYIGEGDEQAQAAPEKAADHDQ